MPPSADIQKESAPSLLVIVIIANKPPSKVALHNFEKWRPILQANSNVVEAGGWYLLKTLSENPKKDLCDYIMDQPKSELEGYIEHDNFSTETTKDNKETTTTLNALIALLDAQGKGYTSELMDGEWIPVLKIRKRKSSSSRIQTLVNNIIANENNNEKYPSISSFMVKDAKFVTHVSLLRGTCDLQSTVEVTQKKTGCLRFCVPTPIHVLQNITFTHFLSFFFLGSLFLHVNFVKFAPILDNFSMIDNKIVLRRISCDMVRVSLKFWKFPRIPLPLRLFRRNEHNLDIMYLDEDMCITARGSNRGHFIIHFRPTFLQTLMTLRQVEGADI